MYGSTKLWVSSNSKYFIAYKLKIEQGQCWSNYAHFLLWSSLANLIDEIKDKSSVCD